MNDDEVTLPIDDLRALFDLAVNTLDFGSGFWDTADTDVARKIAVTLGVDPMEATPSSISQYYPHAFRLFLTSSLLNPTPEPSLNCAKCGLKPRDDG